MCFGSFFASDARNVSSISGCSGCRSDWSGRPRRLLAARRRQPAERVGVRDVVLAVAGDHVVIRGDPLEEILRRAVAAAVVLHLHQVEMAAALDPSARRAASDSSSTSPRASPVKQHPALLALRPGRFGDDHDARHVRHGVVQIVGADRGIVGAVLRLSPLSNASLRRLSCTAFGASTVNVRPSAIGTIFCPCAGAATRIAARALVDRHRRAGSPPCAADCPAARSRRPPR